MKIVLEEASQDRNNNLNILRFIAAVMVVFCHAYPISIGGGGIDALGDLTNGQIHFGSLAVCIFFFFSGFFLNRSVNRGYGAYRYFKARCIRIFPCLIVVVFACTFVLGSFVTSCRRTEYFTNVQTYEYLLNGILILRHNLPGVFEGNAYNATVNGSLWTLPVEFLCYIGCYFFWRIGLSKKRVMGYTIPFFVLGYVVMYIILAKNTLLQSALRPCGMFYCGMLFDTYRSGIHINASYVLACIAGLIVSAYLEILEFGTILFLPYILTYIVFGTKKKLYWFGAKHEISYGMYLCAWPVQQTVVMLFGGNMDPVINFLISMPVIMAIGCSLNVIIEKRIIRFMESKK